MHFKLSRTSFASQCVLNSLFYSNGFWFSKQEENDVVFFSLGWCRVQSSFFHNCIFFHFHYLVGMVLLIRWLFGKVVTINFIRSNKMIIYRYFFFRLFRHATSVYSLEFYSRFVHMTWLFLPVPSVFSSLSLSRSLPLLISSFYYFSFIYFTIEMRKKK